MGSALLKAWSMEKKYSFIIVDPNQFKNIRTKYKNSVQTFKSLDDIEHYNSINVVIFAIKPQIASKVLSNFKKKKFNKKTVFVSIVAGKKINFFNNFLSVPTQFIRVMPNMPAMINEGMTCLFANKHVSKKNIDLINSLFLIVGKTLWLKNELEMNKVTAISGSGPGYVFLIIDAFEKAAIKLGLGKKATKKLVNQTFLGAIRLLLIENKEASTLAKNIAVKGGTTEAGLNEFKNKKILNKIFNKAVKSAYIRANKLGK